MGEMAEAVKRLLPAFGYTPTEKDGFSIEMAYRHARIRALDYCNRSDAPEGLEYEIVRMAAAEFLYQKKITGTLGDGGLAFRNQVTQLTEGDSSVSITMAGKNDESSYQDMMDKMRRGDYFILDHYRRLHW